ncbi:MAG: carboxypeptidase-like regulatory domain-containing protein [Weeksellaceae bacterium]|nr:carboxypeptidase-like regulatory domain-containing protein [Weeksellaceae bacterium]
MSAQNYVFGKVTTEDDVELSLVNVLNMKTEERASTNSDGQFMIRASAGDELRFTKPGYDRISKIIQSENFTKPLNIALQRIPAEIETVEIKYRPTGNLREDVKHFGDRGKVKVLKDEVADYVSRKSSAEVLMPRSGEFVQPVGPGFSVGKVKDRWDDIDFMQFLIENVDDSFFTEELKLTKPEIQPFIYYVFTNFERTNIIKYGTVGPADVARFMDAALREIGNYRNNVHPTARKRR